MNEAEFRAFVNANDFVFAKSMPQSPHWYIVRAKCTSDELFSQAVMFIRANGYPKKFFRATYVYYDLDGFTYWTMGAPLNETIILNRAKL